MGRTFFQRREGRTFANARGGNVAILFALVLPILVGLVFGAVDLSRASAAKQALQDALDAAALHAARSTAVTNKELQDVGSAALAADLVSMREGKLKKVKFRSGHKGRSVIADATAEVPTTIMGFFGKKRLLVRADSEVRRSSSDVEVAMVLDTTGSMAGAGIADLKAAASELVDIVVQDVQKPYYSKVAIVPYSMAVNVGPYAEDVRGSYTPGECNQPGCERFRFSNPFGFSLVHKISSCVSERTGVAAFRDDAPSKHPLGRNYPSPNNPCLGNEILPLTNNKGTLKGAINALEAEGSTAGHVGVAWGWYLVSPNFGYLWPSASQPKKYTDKDVIKAVVIMTDGEYNSVYCDGVISDDSTLGSGSPADQIDCPAPNGDSYEQAQKLCDNMKKAGVVVYTVGLNVINTAAAKKLVTDCATNADHVYLPSSGAALRDAFRTIANDITQLRISR